MNEATEVLKVVVAVLVGMMIVLEHRMAWYAPANYIWMRRHGWWQDAVGTPSAGLAVGFVLMDAGPWVVLPAQVAVIIAYQLFKRHLLKVACEVFVVGYQKTYPNRCSACFFFRFGASHGWWKEPIPEHEECVESWLRK